MRLIGGFWDSIGCLWLLGPWKLAAFGGGEILAIAIPTLVPLLFLLSLVVYAMMILNMSIHTTGTTGEGWGESV